MPAYTTADIRNIAMVGSPGAGKTTLVEAMLHMAGATTRQGKIEERNTVSDHEDLEKEYGHSLNSAIVHFDHAGIHVNIIDTPGRADFVGTAIASFPAVECVVCVLDAGAGIEPVARRLIRVARERKLPCLIVLNKIDHCRDAMDALASVQETFGNVCLPINLPAQGGKKVIDCFQNATGESDLGDVADFHTAILDQIVEMDEALMERYLAQGQNLAPEELHAPFEAALREAHLVPVCFTDAKNGVGVTELLDIFEHLCPNPMEGNPRPFEYGDPGAPKQFRAVPDSKKPLVAHVFKVASDPFVGKLCIFRVHQGAVAHAQQPHVNDGKRTARIGHHLKLQGKDHKEIDQVIAGDIGAVSKLDELHFNDVLHTGEIGEHLHLRPLPLPRPMYGLAIEAASKNAESKLAEALRKMTAEDPTLEAERVVTTGELVLRGLGELHLRAKLRLLKDRYGVEVHTHPPKIAYKESISGKAEGHHRHKKQTGGAGQFGEVFLRVEPIKEGEGENGLLFVDDTFGGSVPKQFLPAIEKGVRQVMATGAIAGYPLRNVKVAVYDGKYHAVDSKEIAFITAGRKAFIDAVSKARPVLLEPYVHLEITVPADHIGDISSDLSGRRGRIQGTDMLPGNQAVVQAEVPLAEVSTYANQLKSITGGTGSYSMAYSHDEPTPPNVQAEIVAKFKPHADEEE